MDKCREEFEKWLDDNNMFMNVERRFDQESNTYDYCAIRWIWESWQHKQAKVEELQNNINLLNEALDIKEQLNQKLREREEELQTLYTQQGINMLKLQKRVDSLEKAEFKLAQVKAILQNNPKLLESILVKKIEQALKGEGQ